MKLFSKRKKRNTFQPVFIEQLNNFDKGYLFSILTLEFPEENFTLESFSVEFLVMCQKSISPFGRLFYKIWRDSFKAGHDFYLCQSHRELLFTQQYYNGYEDYLGHMASMYPKLNFKIHNKKIFAKD